MDQQIEWPVKTREFQSAAIDSTYWNDFAFRNDDIIIGTYAKSGTTWVQQIVAQLIFNGEEGLPVAQMSPWLDFRLPPLEEKLPGIEAQEHRRFIKTHPPVDTLVFSPKAKYLYIARDGRDVVWSFYNHHYYMNDIFYDGIRALPYLGPVWEQPRTNDLREYYFDWFNNEGFPLWPFWENIRTWWAIRDLPNVYLIHYQNLKDDMEGQMREIAAFLDIPIDESRWDMIIHHCSFDYMKD